MWYIENLNGVDKFLFQIGKQQMQFEICIGEYRNEVCFTAFILKSHDD